MSVSTKSVSTKEIRKVKYSNYFLKDKLLKKNRPKPDIFWQMRNSPIFGTCKPHKDFFLIKKEFMEVFQYTTYM